MGSSVWSLVAAFGADNPTLDAIQGMGSDSPRALYGLSLGAGSACAAFSYFRDSDRVGV